MNSKEIKKRVKSFRTDYGLKDVTAESLKEAFQKQGFIIIEYNPILNNPDVSTVIENLKLSEMIARGNGFIYTDNRYRLVFINEKLNEEEKRMVLAHEQGHYSCGHTKAGNVIGRSVQEEYEANEFSHYLLQKSTQQLVKETAFRHRKLLIGLFIVIGLAVFGNIAAKEHHDRQLYEGEYYVTAHGEKYHRENCVTIQGHEIRRLTKKDVTSGDYEPCSVCQPDK